METKALLRRIRALTWVFIVGLVFSGLTALPLQSEVNWLATASRAEVRAGSATGTATIWAWILKVRDAINVAADEYPFLFYGTDWLAFGHFVIAVAFLGAIRDPVRNRWLYDFGMIACVAVIPYALGFGALRGIPIWWRAVDSSFGILGFIPLWLCRRWTLGLERRLAEKIVSSPPRPAMDPRH